METNYCIACGTWFNNKTHHSCPEKWAFLDPLHFIKDIKPKTNLGDYPELTQQLIDAEKEARDELK